MPKLIRTANASYPQDEFDDYHLIEEEEEEDDDYEDDPDDGPDDLDEEGDEHEVEADEEPEEDEHEVDASDEDDEEEAPRQKPSRAQERIRQLAKERKAAREEADALKLQLAQFNQNQQQSRQQTQVNPAEEAAFRASLSPEDLIRYDVSKILQTQKQQSELQIFNMQDTMDRQAFMLKAQTNPVYRRYGSEVERRLLDLRTNQRMNVPREVILQNIIGEAVLTGKHKTVDRGKAKENLKKNKTRPSSNRSDTTRDASRGGSEREKRRKRLENVTF